MKAATSARSDRSFVLWGVGGLFLAILLLLIFTPPKETENPDPTTENAGSQGIKASYLLLSELGYQAERWEVPVTDLRNLDPTRTTLILTQPKLPIKDVKVLQEAVSDFLKRGGRVIATGANGAQLLPNGKTASPENVYQGLCYTEPQGTGTLAKAGKVGLLDTVRWDAISSQISVEQKCGPDAVVVRMRVGQGEAIWWASPTPLTNTGLADDASLKLVLASIGPPGRTVLFDEYLHTWRETVSDTLTGLPWAWLNWQCVALALLLLFSFSRRNGPLRMPLTVPRTSPTEFAQSMGRLYEKAGASQAATEAARSRLLEFLRDQCGLPREILRAHPPRVAAELAQRFGGQWDELEQHLQQAGEAHAKALPSKTALKLVQSLEADHKRLREFMLTRRTSAVVHS